MIKLQAKANWKQIQNPGVPGAKWYKWGDLAVCVGDPKVEGHWHISISHPYRYPTWDEIYTAWYDLVPGAGSDFNGAIILPRKSEYVNKHPNCFHVHQLNDAEVPSSILL